LSVVPELVAPLDLLVLLVLTLNLPQYLRLVAVGVLEKV
jgi:hypothetical protein